jgi:hypothetical protein
VRGNAETLALLKAANFNFSSQDAAELVLAPSGATAGRRIEQARTS